ncbi:MAG TPA: type II secretion system protein GspL [bacterium]|nr:type II secretion system protein GspL [bacterium]
MAKLVVGLDSSGTNWKSVIVSRGMKDKFRIEGYASFPELPFSPSELLASSREDQGITAAILEWADKLREALLPFKNGTRDVVVGMAADPVSLRILELPFTQESRIARVLPFEAESSLPFDSEDLLFDFYTLRLSESKSTVLSAAVKRESVSALLDHLKLLDLDPAILTPACLAFHHLLAVVAPPADAGAFRYAFLDVGDTSSQLAVVEGPRAIFAAGINIGLNELAPSEEGEKDGEGEKGEKSEKSEKGEKGEKSEKGEKGEKGVKGVKVPVDPDRLASSLSAALGRGLHYLEGFSIDGSMPPPPVKRIILIGEGASPGLAQRLSRGLEVETSVFHLPDESMAPDARVPDELHARIAPALALALQKAAPAGRPGLNFRKGEFAFRPERKAMMRKMVLPAVLAAILILTIGLRVSVTGSSDKQRAVAVKKQMEQVFKQYFPNVPVQDPARQLKMMLDDAKAKQPEFEELASPSALDCLAQVSAAIPDTITVTLTSFDYRSGRISLAGDADKLEDPNEITKRLQQVPIFPKVDLEGGSQTQDQRVRFKISIDLKKDAGK